MLSPLQLTTNNNDQNSAKKISFQLHSVFENYQEFQKALEIYCSKTYSTFRIKSSGFTPEKQDYSFVFYKCIHMEDPTKVQGKTKSKGLRPTQNYIKPTKCPQIRVKRNTDGSISSSNSLNLKRKAQTDVPAPNPAPKNSKQTTDPNEPNQRKPRSKKD